MVLYKAGVRGSPAAGSAEAAGWPLRCAPGSGARRIRERSPGRERGESFSYGLDTLFTMGNERVIKLVLIEVTKESSKFSQ